ncbi:MAG: hypothetical protein PHE49_11830 [bacterium]|nr:hypothetical protein [bacterium]
MKKHNLLFSAVFFVAAIACNSFAQYPGWTNYTSGQYVTSVANSGNEL